MEPKYCIKILYIGGESAQPGEPLIGFFRERRQNELNYCYETGCPFNGGTGHTFHLESLFPVPYQYPTFYDSKWDVITAAFKLQAVLERTPERLFFVPYSHSFTMKEYFCKGWEWNEAEFTEIIKANADFQYSYNVRRVLETKKKTAEEW